MAALMGVALLVILVQDIPLSGYVQGVETDRITTTLERDAFMLAGRSEDVLTSADAADGASADSAATAATPEAAAALASVVDAAKAYRGTDGARVVITDRAGTAIVTSDDDESSLGSSYASRPEIQQALAGQVATGSRFSITLAEELLYVSVPVQSGTTVLGAVRLTYPAKVVSDAVQAQVGTIWLVALTTELLAGFVGFIVSASFTRRLSVLRAATEAFADGDLRVRADERAGGAPEIRSLSHSFNRMAVRLSELIDTQRAFAADASHQLRTPLTALRLRLERARELIETDPAAAAERLSAAEVEADRLASLIEGLLVLSRTEASTAPVAPVDLAAIAAERVDQWRALAQESGVEILLEGPGHAMVFAIDTAAEQIIDNFIDNALGASPASSRITVTVDRSGAETTLCVLDEGPGMPGGDYSRAFDRFFSAAPEKAGGGLGLAIVAQLARASGAVATLGPRLPRGSAATAIFVTAADLGS